MPEPNVARYVLYSPCAGCMFQCPPPNRSFAGLVRSNVYRLYGTRRSGSAMVELALAEIGADYELVRTGLGKGAKDSDSYLAVNPTGKLPALETPDGEILT